MKKNLLILLSVLALIFTAYSQVNINITLKVKTNNLKEDSAVYVSGNDVKLGNWQLDAIKLNEQAKGVWLKKFSI